MTIDEQIDNITASLNLSPVQAGCILGQHAVAQGKAKRQASMNGAELMLAAKTLKPEERLQALKAEQSRRLGIGLPDAVAAEIEGLKAQLSSATATIQSLTTQLFDAQAALAPEKAARALAETNLKTFEAEMPRRINAEVTRVVASAGAAPLPISIGGESAGLVNPFRPAAGTDPRRRLAASITVQDKS